MELVETTLVFVLLLAEYIKPVVFSKLHSLTYCRDSGRSQVQYPPAKSRSRDISKYLKRIARVYCRGAGVSTKIDMITALDYPTLYSNLDHNDPLACKAMTHLTQIPPLIW